MSELDDLVKREQSGQILIGIDRTVARKVFTDVPLGVLQEKIGEVPYLEKRYSARSSGDRWRSWPASSWRFS